MSYNGSGTFVINTAGQPVVSGTVISSTAFNALTADLANGLSTAITKDGQTTPTANIPMGNNKITGLAVGTAATDAANLGQVQSTAAKLINSVSGADTITGTLSPTLTAYAAGQMFYFVAAGDNTGAVTLNINSLGAKSVTRDGTTALVAGDIKSGEVCVVVYDGTQFQLVNAANSFGDLNVTGNLTLSGGTANGVLYLNGSKVATSGSALTFDGTNLGIGTSSPAYKLDVSGTGNFGGANPTLYIQPTTNTNNALMRCVNAGGTAYVGLDNNAAGLTANYALNLYHSGAYPINFSTNGTLRATIDASGNLGLGVTPSAWTAKAIQVNARAAFWGDTTQTIVSNNMYASSGGDRYIATATAALYAQSAGQHIWFTAPSGTAGNTISFTQAMTLDASGRLGIGTTSPNAKLQVKSAADAFRIEGTTARGSGNIYMSFYDPTGRKGYFGYGASDETLYLVNEMNAPIIFTTNGIDRALFTAAGGFAVGTTTDPGAGNIGLAAGKNLQYSSTAYITPEDNSIGARISTPGAVTFWTGGTPAERARISSGGAFSVNTTSASSQMNMYHNGATTAGFTIRNTDTGSATQNAVLFERNTTIVGSITTTNAATAYVTSSDRRLKDNIIPADDAGSVIDSIEIVQHDWKVGGHVRYGVIAQDLNQVAPEAVQQGDDGDDIEKPWGVDYSKLVPMLVKEIQSLRSRVAALEAK